MHRLQGHTAAYLILFALYKFQLKHLELITKDLFHTHTHAHTRACVPQCPRHALRTWMVVSFSSITAILNASKETITNAASKPIMSP